MKKPKKIYRSSRPTDVVAWPEKTTGSEVAAETRSELNKLDEPGRQALEEKAAAIMESASESPAAAPEVKPQPAPEVVVAAPQRTSGAGWFIPPQGPSGFGVKKD